MKGAIIGDVVGSVYEWHNIKRKDFDLFGATFYHDRHFFTDDTVMTLAVAEGLAVCRDWTDGTEAVDCMAKTLRRWGRAYPHRGYGGRFKEWLHDSQGGAYNSWGNGAPMRASPAGWLADSREEALWLGRLTALPTHDHPYGVKAAQCVALLVYLARHGADMDALRRETEAYYTIPSLDVIRPGYKFDVSSEGTMPAALAAFFEATDFEDAIRNAISVGGDSDTIAAITGSIAEAYFGIPTLIWNHTLPYLDRNIRRHVRGFYEGIQTE